MYVLRDDAATQTLRIELSGRVSTAEATRAVSQALALAGAGGRTRAVCDLTGVRLGPEELEAVAAVLKCHASVLRMAFVGRGPQLTAAIRFAELASLERFSGVFTTIADADAWLGDQSRSTGQGEGLQETARRHLGHPAIAAELVSAPRGRAEPAA